MSFFEEVAQEIEAGRLMPFVLFRGKTGEFAIDFGTKPDRWPDSASKSAEYRRVLADALVTERAKIVLTGDGYRITEVRA